MNNFLYAMTLTNSLYGLDLNEDDWIETALIAWNYIGNRRCRLYRFSARINCETLSVTLPCNADIIEAVTYSFEDWKYTTNDLPEGNLNSAFVEEYIESRKTFTDPLYISGKYAHYERVGDTLYFDKDYGVVNVLYKGQVVDEEGLPEITDKEAIAIATYVAYTEKYKEGLRTNNTNILAIAQMLQKTWNQKCDAARVPTYIDQNDMNEILDASTSWNRKIFNKKYAPILN